MTRTQRVPMEVEIGAQYVCGPCTRGRFGMCVEFNVPLKTDEFTGLSEDYPGEELTYEMRCDQCLERWPPISAVEEFRRGNDGKA